MAEQFRQAEEALEEKSPEEREQLLKDYYKREFVKTVMESYEPEKVKED